MSTPANPPRLSDLIREGLSLPEVKEDHGEYFEIDPPYVYACALGMAYYALMRRQGIGAAAVEEANNRRANSFRALFPDDLPEHAITQRCPASWEEDVDCDELGPLLWVVDHLHNIHDWPAQRIASWLDETVYADSAAVRS